MHSVLRVHKGHSEAAGALCLVGLHCRLNVYLMWLTLWLQTSDIPITQCHAQKHQMTGIADSLSRPLLCSSHINSGLLNITLGL